MTLLRPSQQKWAVDDTTITTTTTTTTNNNQNQNHHQQQQHTPTTNDGNGDDKGGDDDDVYEDAPINQGLLSRKQKRLHPFYDPNTAHDEDGNSNGHNNNPQQDEKAWLRPYWLGGGLFWLLGGFWILDSLKDPLFVQLVDGQLNYHQPRAKVCSVLTTLVLVCLIEYWTTQRAAHRRQQRRPEDEEKDVDAGILSHDHVLAPGGRWTHIPIQSSAEQQQHQQHQQQQQALDDTASMDLFYVIGIPYCLLFVLLSYCVWRFEQQPAVSASSAAVSVSASASASFQNYDPNPEQPELLVHHTTTNSGGGWYLLGYVWYATIESFGSLMVAAFWSYTNTTLSLPDAERYYGPIVAIAQVGAILGATVVATGRWSASTLVFVVGAGAIVLHVLCLYSYDHHFTPTSLYAMTTAPTPAATITTTTTTPVENWRKGEQEEDQEEESGVSGWTTTVGVQDTAVTVTKPFYSGLYLIVQHSYVLLILGVSCLYEISMTLLDYQLKLLGVAKFRATTTSANFDAGDSSSNSSHPNEITTSTMSFTEFIGHYGQVVNITSLVFSSLLFPFLIRRFGLRKTLLGFPTMLLVVTVLAYGALPGNLTVLFVSLSLLKAMTYSVHDPAKELLYIPTSNAIKLRAKFWIDVVGERITKAIGSGFNTLASTVDESVAIGSLPSLVSGVALWWACYYIGRRFEELLATGKIVGLEHAIDPSTYQRIPHHNDDDDDNDDDELFSEVEIHCAEQDTISVLDLMADPVVRNSTRERTNEIELPALSSTIC